MPLLAVLGACASTEPAAPAAPADVFAALEERLLAAEDVAFVFHITSEGAVDSDLRGRLELHGDRADLVAEGQFATRPLQLRLTTAQNELRGGTDPAHAFGLVPPALREGLLLGLTRMGLLHNLAMLSGDRPPDGTDGTIRGWAKVSDFRDAGDGVIGFAIEVGGRPAGEATLELENGLPLVRHQTVRFSQDQTMRVVERYSGFRVL